MFFYRPSVKCLAKINWKVRLTLCKILCLRKAAVEFLSANRFHDNKFNRCLPSVPLWHRSVFLKTQDQTLRTCQRLFFCSAFFGYIYEGNIWNKFLCGAMVRCSMCFHLSAEPTQGHSALINIRELLLCLKLLHQGHQQATQQAFI